MTRLDEELTDMMHDVFMEPPDPSATLDTCSISGEVMPGLPAAEDLMRPMNEVPALPMESEREDEPTLSPRECWHQILQAQADTR